MHIDLERRKIILQKIKSYLGMKRGTWTPTDKWMKNIFFTQMCICTWNLKMKTAIWTNYKK